MRIQQAILALFRSYSSDDVANAEKKKARNKRQKTSRGKKSSPRLTVNNAFAQEVNTIIRSRKRSRNRNFTDEQRDKINNLVGSASGIKTFQIGKQKFISGLFWKNLQVSDKESINLYLKLIETPRGAFYHVLGNDYGLINPFFEDKHTDQISLAIAVMNMQKKGLIPKKDFSSQGSHVLEIYQLLTPNRVYIVGIYDGTTIINGLDTSFNPSVSSLENTIDEEVELLSEACEDSGGTLTVRKVTLSETDFEEKETRTLKYTSSQHMKKRTTRITLFVIILLSVISSLGAVYGYILHQENERIALEKKIKAQERMRIMKKEAEAKLISDANEAVRFNRTYPGNLSYKPIIDTSLNLANSISYNKGNDRWQLLGWGCEVTRSRGEGDIYADFVAECEAIYDGEALSEYESFREYRDLFKKTVNITASAFQKENNLAAIKYTIQLPSVSKNSHVNVAQKNDAIRELQRKTEALALKNVDFHHTDMGEVVLDQPQYREALLIQDEAGKRYLPFGFLEWELKSKINNLRGEGMNITIPYKSYITKVTGNAKEFTITGVYYYE
ncbi:hypothetical protein [Marinomonas sp. 2405UD68-3]|uniref:hypothetical protein n=1 Tax=Marinomonas sp. 2405UD68-3 TaxID=3391835 RepID=UPI0039C992D2